MAYSHEQRLTRLEDHDKDHEKRISNLEDVNNKINDINLNIKEIAMTQKGMLDSMKTEQEISKKHEERLDNLEKKPAESAEKVKWIIITAVITTVISGVVGGVLGWFINALAQKG